MNSLLDAALKYTEHGIAVIPVGKCKEAVVKWKQFTEKAPTRSQIRHIFQLETTLGLAILCGKVNRNLEVIDVDSKNDLSNHLFSDLLQAIKDHFPQLAPRLVIAQTPSGGYHLFYRCREISRNQKLASRPSTPAEKAANPDENQKVLLETRGNYGYVAAWPTSGYQFIQHDITMVPFITSKMRTALFSLCRRFNQVPEKQIIRRRRPADYSSNNNTPFNDFNQRGDVLALLQKHGWKIVGEEPEKTLFLRPGNTDKRSSGNYNHRLGLFSVFTQSTVFIAETGYRPAAVFAMLECDGDFHLAAKKLYHLGYGDRQNNIIIRGNNSLRNKK